MRQCTLCNKSEDILAYEDPGIIHDKIDKLALGLVGQLATSIWEFSLFFLELEDSFSSLTDDSMRTSQNTEYFLITIKSLAQQKKKKEIILRNTSLRLRLPHVCVFEGWISKQ